jgi:electron transport complex protein RnfC
MLEKPVEILTGAAILGRAAGVNDVYIAVEANKADAIARLEKYAPEFGVQILTLPVAYPQGSEKQLIYVVTGKKVPSGGLPADTGCVVQNVATADAIRAAVIDGVPLTTRVVTVTGDAVVEPGNWRMRIGTPFNKAIALAGGVKYEPAKFISGGPMMGFAQKNFASSVQKNTSGLLLLGAKTIYQYDSTPCIRCGRCLDVCPMKLSPGPLSMQIECEEFELANNNHVMDCLECGSCAFVCPSRRPLVQHFRRAKNEIRQAAAARKESNNTK